MKLFARARGFFGSFGGGILFCVVTDHGGAVFAVVVVLELRSSAVELRLFTLWVIGYILLVTKKSKVHDTEYLDFSDSYLNKNDSGKSLNTFLTRSLDYCGF